jgi:uncharacterized Zn finger protein
VSYFYDEWAPYVSVAQRRREAQRHLGTLKKEGRSVAPVTIDGRTIAKTFWGKSWCANLERYSDFASRLPRGRSYVRNGSVVDLQVSKGKIAAIVAGSELYSVKIAVAPVATKRWKAICRDCAGNIDSLIELLQGRLAKDVTERLFRDGSGLFPSPKEIRLSCSCPDWAGMCKHVAATLYGVGARLDKDPELLFVLREVDKNDLLANAGRDLAAKNAAPGAAKLLPESDVAALFGLDMAVAGISSAPLGETSEPVRHRPGRRKTAKRSNGSKLLAAGKKTKPRAKPDPANRRHAVRPPRLST